jgi:hypothetical protein
MKWPRITLLAALSIWGCSQEPVLPIDGVWHTGPFGSHFQDHYLFLQQQGNDISGSACGGDSGFVLYRQAPIRTRYPMVAFVVTPDTAGPCCPLFAGFGFTGRATAEGTIVGHLGFPERDPGAPTVYFRSPDPLPKACQ